MTVAELERLGCATCGGHEMARATLENAVLDLIAKSRTVPSTRSSGRRKRILSGISLGIRTRPPPSSRPWTTVAKKYHRVKMKGQERQDLEYVRAVRERFPVSRSWWTRRHYRLDDAAHLARSTPSIS